MLRLPSDDHIEERAPDFYLTANAEFDLLAEMRACWSIDRLRDSRRDDHMLVAIQPLLIGQWFGLGDRDITQLILSTPHEGCTLFPITEWPSYVHVARIVDDSILATRVFRPEQVEYFTKAALYRTPSVPAPPEHFRAKLWRVLRAPWRSRTKVETAVDLSVRQLVQLLESSGARIWRPGDPVAQTGRRLLIGVSPWATVDAELIRRVLRHRPVYSIDMVVDFFDLDVLVKNRNPEDYFSSVPTIDSTPVAGLWIDGQMTHFAQGDFATRLVSDTLQIPDDTG